MTNSLLRGALVAVATAVTLPAQTLVQIATFSASADGAGHTLPWLSGTFTYQLFSPTLGTLTGVDLELRVNSAAAWTTETNTTGTTVPMTEWLQFDAKLISPHFGAADEPVLLNGPTVLTAPNAAATFAASLPPTTYAYSDRFARPAAGMPALSLADFVGSGTDAMLYGMGGTTSTWTGTNHLETNLAVRLTYTYATPERAWTAPLFLAATALLGATGWTKLSRRRV